MSWYKDIEDLQDAFVEILKNDLNAEIAAIDASKSVVLNIQDIPTDAYFDSLDRNACRSSFLLYGIENIEPFQNGDELSERVSFAFIACYDSADNLNFNRMILRVQRALQNVISKAWRKKISNDFTITKTTPLLLPDDSGDFTKAGGIIVEAII